MIEPSVVKRIMGRRTAGVSVISFFVHDLPGDAMNTLAWSNDAIDAGALVEVCDLVKKRLDAPGASVKRVRSFVVDLLVKRAQCREIRGKSPLIPFYEVAYMKALGDVLRELDGEK